MKKYVLNIEKLYSGQTSNALVLNQVDEQLPDLLPIPGSNRDKWVEQFGKTNGFVYDESWTDDELDERIIEFNLGLHSEFKNRGHHELYMIDDTIDDINSSFKQVIEQKKFMHLLNGLMEGKSIDEQNPFISQLNILFPWKKISYKSIYQSLLKVQSQIDLDEELEHSRNITLQGKVSYLDCLQGVAKVGNEMYMMSPLLSLGDGKLKYANGQVVVVGEESPVTFPSSMTLFQPSNGRNSDIEQFRQWYSVHNNKVVIQLNETYGTNVSTLKYLGKNSYELVLATYGPTDLKGLYGGNEVKTYALTSPSFRQIRSKENTTKHKYLDGGRYSFNFEPNTNESELESIGFFFNMYDNFIDGNERKMRMVIPKSKDYNKVILKFKLYKVGDFDGMEYQVRLNDELVTSEDDGEISVTFFDSSIQEQAVEFSVLIHAQIDYNRRNQDESYVNMLRNTGICIEGIKVVQGNQDEKVLTFGSYVNEDGISDEERLNRYEQFWRVSKFYENMPYQSILETSLNNTTSSGILNMNNYSSGDMYGDVFTTKSLLDSKYDTSMNGDMVVSTRDYIGLDGCSNQLALFFKNASIVINDNGVANVQEQNDELKYQNVEVVKNINRFESSIKHKSNVFSIVVENSNLAENKNATSDEDIEIEAYKRTMRDSITQFVRNTCNELVPVHTQLFDVQFI